MDSAAQERIGWERVFEPRQGSREGSSVAVTTESATFFASVGAPSPSRRRAGEIRKSGLTPERPERERAYGVEAVPGDSPGVDTVVFKAQPKRRLTIRMLNGCPVATTPIGGRDGILRRVFVQSKEGSMLPKVAYVEIFGEDAATGAPLYEKFVPGK